MLGQCVNYVLASLRAPVRRLHRIEDDRAISMKTDPVIREYGIRRVWFQCVIDLHHLNAISVQCSGQSVEFSPGVDLLLLRRRLIPALETI